MSDLPLEISCQQLAEQLRGPEPPLVVDCREEEEHALVALAGATLIPMSQMEQRVGELSMAREQAVVVYCHLGMRSAQVTMWLRQRGFVHVQSLAGGIDAWAVEIDPSLPRY